MNSEYETNMHFNKYIITFYSYYLVFIFSHE